MNLLLTAVVGRRHAAVGEKDEELAAPRLNQALQLASGRMGGGDTDQGIEAPRGVGGQRAVLQARSSLADADRLAQMIPRLAPALGVRLAGRATGAVLRRWNVRIGRRLARFADRRLQFGKPPRQTLDQSRLLGKQGVLFSLTQTIARRLLNTIVTRTSSFPRA
jgi:hypothetical protein